MRRRRLLGALAGVSLGTVTAGCAESSPGGRPQIVERAFTTEDGSCGTGEDTAQVTFATDGVRVGGRLATPTPCHGAALASAALVDSRLVVAIEQTAPTTDACVQCLGTVPYGLSVQFADDPPDEVVVEHDGERVTTARR